MGKYGEKTNPPPGKSPLIPILDEISADNRNKKEPFLTALVVAKDTNLPGPKFFENWMRKYRNYSGPAKGLEAQKIHEEELKLIFNYWNDNPANHKKNTTIGFVVGAISFLIYFLTADLGGSDEAFGISLIFGGPLGIIVSFIVGRITKFDLKKNLLVGTLAGASIGLIIVLILISFLGPDDGVVGAFVIPGAIVGLAVAKLQSKPNDASKPTGATPSQESIKDNNGINHKNNVYVGAAVGGISHFIFMLISGWYYDILSLLFSSLIFGGIIGGTIGFIVGKISYSKKDKTENNVAIGVAVIIVAFIGLILTYFLNLVTDYNFPSSNASSLFVSAIVSIVVYLRNTRSQATGKNIKMSGEIKTKPISESVEEIKSEYAPEIIGEDKQTEVPIISEKESQPLTDILVKSAFSYKGATILYKIKVENPTPEPIADIKVTLFVPDVFLLSDPTKNIAMLKPDEGKTVTFEIRPTGECGDCNISGKVVYYDYSTKKTRESEIPPKNLSIVCPMLRSKEISEDAWRSALSGFTKAEESTKDIDMPASTLFDITSDILRDMNLYMLEPKINDSHDLYRAIARFYGEGVKELQYAAQIEVIGGSKKSRFILKAWAEREEALTGFYHGILDEIEKRVHVKGLIDTAMVQNIYQYGDRIGTQVKDSFVYKSSINDDAKTCPSCGREVGEDEQFCTECGERLI